MRRVEQVCSTSRDNYPESHRIKISHFLKKGGAVTVISKIKPGKLFNGCRAVFLYTPIGIVELLENKTRLLSQFL